MNRNIKKSVIFIALTFVINYLMVILFLALGGKWDMTSSMTLGTAYMFIPMIVAIIVQKGIYKEPLIGPLGISWKLNWWWLLAWWLPPIIAFAIFGVSLLLPGVSYSPEMAGLIERFKDTLSPEQLQQIKDSIAMFPIHPIWLGLMQGMIAGITINAVAGFGEELGWRGFLQNELSYLGFWKSSAIIGVVWGVWHAPLILQGHNYPQHTEAGVFMMIVFCLLLAPIFSFIRLKAKSVIAAAIIHGSLNATMGLSIMLVKGGSDLLIGGTGLAGFIVLAMLNVGIFVYNRVTFKQASP
ncbi:CPBP family intramembrane glutamic endopeptidase [Chloroflexota bacterium]